MTDEECQDVSDTDPHFDARKEVFAMYYTTGTTGIPKCVVLSQYYFNAQVERRKYVYSQLICSSTWFRG